MSLNKQYLESYPGLVLEVVTHFKNLVIGFNKAIENIVNQAIKIPTKQISILSQLSTQKLQNNIKLIPITDEDQFVRTVLLLR